MADNENDIIIDGKSLFSLRVVDLKQELKKRGIKANGTKAQLQNLLIYHLNEANNKVEVEGSETLKQSDDEISQQVTEPSDSSPATNPLSVDDEDSRKPNSNEQSDGSTDLSKESAITSSVSINEEKNSIKLTIKLQPNDHSSKQLSPKKEIKAPLLTNQENETSKLETLNDERKISESEDLSANKETTEIVTDLTLAEAKQTEQNLTTNEISEKVVEPSDSSSEKEVITESVSEEQNETDTQSCQETNEETAEPSVSSSEKEVITETLPVIEEKQTKSQPNDEIVEPIVSSDQSSEIVVENENKSESERKDVGKVVDKNESEQKVEKVDENKSESEQKAEKVVDENRSESEPKIEKVVDENKSESEPKIEKAVDENKSESEPKIEKAVDENRSESEPKVENVVNESKSESEPKTEKVRPPRKRRWGSTTTGTESQQNTYKGISSDQLKELIPDLNSSAITNSTTTNATTVTAKVSKSESSLVVTSNLSRPQTSSVTTEMPSKRDIRVVRKQVSVLEDSSTSNTEESSKPLIPKVEQKKIVKKADESQDEVKELKREVGPAKNPQSNILFITNLVRPFTLLQLKDVLGKTGKLVEQQFWIDKIKSKCFATYETVEEAIATRQALHGIQWPVSNPKFLSVDFATKEELDSHLNAETGINKDGVNNKRNDENVVNEKYDIVIKTGGDKSVFREKNENNDTSRNKTDNRPIREWDREKLVDKEEADKSRVSVKKRLRSPSPSSRNQERTDTKRRRHDSAKGGERTRSADQTSGPAPAAGTGHETESPAKLLDDLFKKTTATPSIYWLPLTEEQVVARDAQRAEEEKKRQEERNAREEQSRKRHEAMQNERRGMEGEPPFRNERGQWRRSNSPNRRNLGPRRTSPSRRPSPRRSPPRRSPPARRSPPRRPVNPRYSRSPVNRRSPPRRKR